MTEKSTRLAVQPGWQAADEAKLVASACTDPDAFGRLYDHYVQPVYAYLYSRVGSAPEAEDITAQTFLAALEGINRYHDQGYFAAWLFSIAHHKMVEYFRKQHRQLPLLAAEQVPAAVDTLQQMITSERSAALQQLIKDLPEEERELIRLRYVADLHFSEIAALLGRTEESTKKTLYRLLDRIHMQLEEHHD